MEKAFTFNLAVGITAALLTALEYFLSTLSALAIRAAIHGCWLIGLHRGGKAPLDAKERLKRAFRKDIATAFMGVWLVLGVALVESNLNSGVLISDEGVNSTECVSVYGKYEPSRIGMNTPPFRTTIEPWVLKVAAQLDCGDRGIASVGVGGATDSYGSKQNMSAPVCAEDSFATRNRTIQAGHTAIKVQRFYMQPSEKHSERFALFPIKCFDFGTDVMPVLFGRDGTGPCGKRGISRFFTVSSPSLQTTFAHALNMSRALHQEMCHLHGNKPVVALDDDIVRSCVDDENINGGCLRSKASNDTVYSVQTTQVAALFVGEKPGSPSYACPNVTVEQHYVFINPHILHELEGSAHANLKVLLVTSARVVDGYCERTIAVLGQAALLYSADASWRDDPLALLDRRTLYYAYVMAVSSAQFPLNKIDGMESPRINGSCFVRPVAEATEVAVDWRFSILVSGLACAAVMICVAIFFRVTYTGESWSVGSAHWSLSRLLDGDSEENAMVFEVVAVASAEDSFDERDNLKPSTPQSNTDSMIGPNSRSPQINSPHQRNSTSGDSQYKYVVRSTKRIPKEGQRKEEPPCSNN